MTAQELRARVCAQARKWQEQELREADGSHCVILAVYNAIRPLPRGYAMKPTDPWCAAFVSAVGAACGLESVILPECACDRMIDAYKAHGRWVEADDYPAKPGDLIFYDWQDSGTGDCQGSADHVGIVVEDTEHYFVVIEGNYSDAVKKRTIAHNSRFIRGFAVPDYESAADGSQEAATAPQSGAELLDRPEGAATAEDAQESAEPRETCTVELPVLRYGGTGETVRAAQGILIAHGVSVGPDKTDGDFGRNTRNGVCNFQRSRGLAVDGVIGEETWRALLGI
jgi:hypothetical protein